MKRCASPAELGLQVAAAPAGEAREGDREDQRHAVEDLLDPAGQAEQLQPGDPGHQEVDGDERPPRVEAAGHDRRRAEEGGGEGGQQEALAHIGVGRPEQPGEHHPADRGEAARGDQRAGADRLHADARQAGHLAPGADEVEVAPERREREDVPAHDRQQEAVVEAELDAEELVARGVDERLGDAAELALLDREAQPDE